MNRLVSHLTTQSLRSGQQRKAHVGQRIAAQVCTGLMLATGFLGACTTTNDGPTLSRPSSADEDLIRRASIRVEIASNFYDQGNMAIAIDEANKALSVIPDYAPAHGLLGLIYLKLNDKVKAEQSFRRALDSRPADPDLNNNFGWFLCQTGREAASIPYFLNASRDPLYAAPSKPLHNAGICSMRMGKDADAEGYFQRAQQIDPNNAVAAFNLGEMYLRRGDLPRADVQSRRLLDNFSPSAQTLWLTIRIQQKMGDRDQVGTHASKLRRLFPQSEELKLFLQNRYE